MVIGLEYTIVGWCRHKWLLCDKAKLETILRDICLQISMTALASISVEVDAELEKLKAGQFEDEGGASASLILSTSHINIHGWPYRDEKRSDGGFFWFTIGSCRTFNVSDVDRILDDTLGITDADRFQREIQVP